MRCSVYIATSADGFIATPEGGVDWLHEAGDHAADMSETPDMGFSDFIDTVDCMIMGRKCMEVISSFNLTDEQWPYRDIKIYALSNTLRKPPENLRGKVEMYSGDINTLITKLENDGLQHAYIDGGTTITAFIELKLINELIITRAPILLGKGLPLFGEMNSSVELKNATAVAFANGFVQVKYQVVYAN